MSRALPYGLKTSLVCFLALGFMGALAHAAEITETGRNRFQCSSSAGKRIVLDQHFMLSKNANFKLTLNGQTYSAIRYSINGLPADDLELYNVYIGSYRSLKMTDIVVGAPNEVKAVTLYRPLRNEIYLCQQFFQ